MGYLLFFLGLNWFFWRGSTNFFCQGVHSSWQPGTCYFWPHAGSSSTSPITWPQLPPPSQRPAVSFSSLPPTPNFNHFNCWVIWSMLRSTIFWGKVKKHNYICFYITLNDIIYQVNCVLCIFLVILKYTEKNFITIFHDYFHKRR